ncbi:MAG TPA: GGDEF domain-containing protein [Bdellovibrionota bacterium]|jgi:diguanylate cyclase (GGDEF)-like protein
MKLKYKLFLSIFPLCLLLLTICFSYVSRQDSHLHLEQIDSTFASGLSGLSEFTRRQEDSLKLAANLASHDAFWNHITAANEKETLPQLLTSLQRKTGLDLVFFTGADGQLREANLNGQRVALDDLRTSIELFPVRKKAGFFSYQGKIYQIAATSVASGSQVGYVGVASAFPIGSYLRSSSGLESVVAGKDGKWSGASLALNDDDGLRLTNLAGDEIERISLSGSSYYARTVKLDPDQPGMRLAVLLPSAPIDKRFGGSGVIFFFCYVVATLASIGIAWGLALSISRPLELMSKTVHDLTSTGSAHAPPASLLDRRDELGVMATNFDTLVRTVGDELKQKEKALSKLEKYQQQLLDLNHRMAKKLYENRVMLTLWKEQEKAEDTKDFLSHVLEEVLQGLPFQYGCIIIRPLAQIGPEVILARIERTRSGKEDVSVTDILERSDRTLWLSSLSPELKEFLLKMNHESANNLRLLQEVLTASIEPETPVRNLSVISLRLAQGNQHMGSMHLIAEKERFSLNASDEEFLISVAAQVSVVLDNRSLQYATRVDPLTRLYNRGYMNDRLREEMLRTSRTNRPFTFMLLDIDHFKKVNDTYGHPAGDEVLVGLSSLLKRSCRASDAICRYGGEELGLILADTPLTGAKTFAENIRKTIEAEIFSIPDGKSLKVTVSMGMAEFPSQAASTTELIKHADEALYQAKREGRNLWRTFSA